ncbi:allergen Tha p 1 [Amyelois transitella]|uniref:allergen Tha p 1 n=1 Tax=Amyelois transitella TaxID=680683 RepID=UPI002990696B|nr:allergen Tha p 1 [Amyelois transitella]
MRVFIILAILIAVTASAEEEKDYTAFFKDETKLKTSMDCLLDKAPCGELQGLKDKFPTLVKDDCGACSPEQKTRYDVVKKILQDNYPEYYKALQDKYQTENPPTTSK